MAVTYSIVSVDAGTPTRESIVVPVGTPYRSIWLDDDLPSPLVEVRVRLDTGQALRLKPDQVLTIDDCVAPRGGVVVEWDVVTQGRIVLAIGGA